MRRFLSIATILLPLCAALSNVAQAQVDWLQDIRAGQSKTIVTMGTSLTAQPTWVPQITAWLKNEAPSPGNVNIVNVGVGGASSDNITPALSGIHTQLPNANAQHPDVVFIEYSMNDAYTPYGITESQALVNLNTIVSGLRVQNPDIEIVLMTMNNPAGANLANAPNIANYYQGYRDVAAANSYALVDHEPNWVNLYNSDPATWNNYVPDGIHPNGLGAARVTTPEIRRELAGEVTFAVGGFESIPFDGSLAYVAHNSGIGVWGVTNDATAGNAAILWNADGLQANFPDINASEGANMITLQADNHLGTISQTFDTLVGQQYEVTFDHSILSGLSSPLNNASAQDLTLRVSASGAGNVAQEYTLTSDDSVGLLGTSWTTLPYTKQSYLFVATSMSTMLTFANQTLYHGEASFGTTIDNIQVSPVPEPSSLALLLAGSVMLWRVGKKRM